MVDVASSLYHARFSTRWHLAGEPVPRVYWFFPWKKKMFSGWHTRATGCRDIALNSRVMETGNRLGGGFLGWIEGDWRVAGLRGSFRNFLDDWFRLGGYSLGDELVFNGETHGLNAWIFELTILKNTIIYPNFI